MSVPRTDVQVGSVYAFPEREKAPWCSFDCDHLCNTVSDSWAMYIVWFGLLTLGNAAIQQLSKIIGDGINVNITNATSEATPLNEERSGHREHSSRDEKKVRGENSILASAKSTTVAVKSCSNSVCSYLPPVAIGTIEKTKRKQSRR